MNNLRSSDAFQNPYNALVSALKIESFGSKTSDEIEEISRLILDVHGAARTELDKTRLCSLAGRVAVLNEETFESAREVFPNFESLREVLGVWRTYSPDAAYLPQYIFLPNGGQRADIVLAMEEIPPERRTPAVIRSMISLFQGTITGPQREALLDAIVKIPPDLRVDVIESAFSMIGNRAHGCVKAEILEILGEFSPELRLEVGQELSVCEYVDQKEDVLRILREFPSERRTPTVIRSIVSLVQNITRGDAVRKALFEAIVKIPPDLRLDVIEKATPLLKNVWGEGYKALFEAVAKIPENLRSDVIATAMPFFEKYSSGYNRANILSAVSLIPPFGRIDAVLRQAVTLFQKSPRELAAFEKIPEDQRVDVLERVLPVLEGVTKDYKRASLLEEIGKIPSNERTAVIEQAQRFRPYMRDVSELDHIVEVLGSIPPDQREDAVAKTLPLCRNGFGELLEGFIESDILRVVASIPGDQRSDVIAEAAPFLRDLPQRDFHYGTVLDAVFSIARDRRTALIRRTGPFVKDIPEGDLRAYVLSAADLIPAEQRTDSVLQAIVFLFKNIYKEATRSEIFRVLKEIPPELRADVLEKMPVFLDDGEKVDSRAKILEVLSWRSGEITGSWLRLFRQIAKIRPTSLRYQLAVCMLLCMSDTSTKRLFESPEFENLFSREHTAPFRLLTALLWEGGPFDEALEATAAVLNSSRYKDSERKKIVLSSFIVLLHTKNLSVDEKKRCLRVLFPKDEIYEIEARKKGLKIKRRELKTDLPAGGRTEETERQKERSLIDRINLSLSVMESIANLGFFKRLATVEKPEDFMQILVSLFQESTGISDVDDLFEKYLKTFGSHRKPESLFIYAGKLKQLPEELRGSVANALKTYVEEVLNGDFPASRYSEASSIHLKTVFKDNPELKRLWTEGETVRFEEICEKSIGLDASSFDPKKYLVQRVLTDRHISRDKVPYLAAYLNTANFTGEELSANLQSLTEFVEEHPENTDLRKELNLLQMQSELISLLQKPPHERLEIFINGIKPLIENVFHGEELFKRDLTDLESALTIRTKQNSFAGWTVVDTDDPIDLLLCGTEVIGSCQNIHSSEVTNKCLLAYLLDGKNRLVAVKNKKGEIVARAIVRILWDQEQNVPVLFRERSYFKPPETSQISQVLDRMCIERAQKLNLPLVTQKTELPGGPPGYPDRLVSLSSRAPFEYSDAGGGITTGEFAVKGVIVQPRR